jgi:lysine-specific permease
VYFHHRYIIAYDDPNLLQAAASENIALSPFTLLYEKAGFALLQV